MGIGSVVGLFSRHSQQLSKYTSCIPYAQLSEIRPASRLIAPSGRSCTHNTPGPYLIKKNISRLCNIIINKLSKTIF